jgi:serine/threonine-protein kinase RsbW
MPMAQSVSTRTGPSTPPDGGWRETQLSATADMIAYLEQLTAELADRDWPGKDAFAIRLSLEEAIVNAIKHGHQNDPSKRVRIRDRLQADTFLAEVEDDGAGFNPHDLPDPTEPENLNRPCGRGVFLMRQYMTWIRFNERGNCVTLCKYRAAL